MIIQMNATVCADMNHGEDGQCKIAGSDLGKSVQEGPERGSDQENQELRVGGGNAGSSGDDGRTRPTERAARRCRRRPGRGRYARCSAGFRSDHARVTRKVFSAGHEGLLRPRMLRSRAVSYLIRRMVAAIFV
jgi:hypothetical protein